MPDQAVAQNNENKPDSDVGENEPKRNSTVSKERIERLKRAFKPTWLIDQLNAPEKNSTKKNK